MFIHFHMSLYLSLNNNSDVEVHVMATITLILKICNVQQSIFHITTGSGLDDIHSRNKFSELHKNVRCIRYNDMIEFHHPR